MYFTTHLEDTSGIIHFLSGSEAYGRLDLTDKFPPPSPLGSGLAPRDRAALDGPRGPPSVPARRCTPRHPGGVQTQAVRVPPVRCPAEG
eukprot:7931889-Pyramimonas_sp.AAC.2